MSTNLVQNTNLSALRSRLVSERESLTRRLETLNAQISILDEAGAIQGPTAVSAPNGLESKGNAVSGGAKERAPKGTLTGAILAALAKGPKKNNEIRQHMIETGYSYSVERLHFSKTLQRLVELKTLVATGPRNNRDYAIAPKRK